MTNVLLHRTTTAILTNKSGGSVAQGDVVILGTATAKAFTTTTTGAYKNSVIGVVLEPAGIAADAQGKIAVGGWVPKINLASAATLYDLIKTHTVAKQGTPHAAPVASGDFAIALQASATPEAVLLGAVEQVGSAEGFLLSGVNQIDGLTEEAAPASGDWFLMEDGVSGALKKVDSDNLPGGGGGGGNFSIAFDVGTTTAGQNQNRTSAGSFTAHRAYITVFQPIKLSQVKWDVSSAKTYTVKILRGWQTTTVWADLGTQVTAGRTAEVTWSGGDLLMMPGKWTLELSWSGAAVVDDSSVDGSTALPNVFRFFEFDRTQYDSTIDLNQTPALKLVAYLGAESVA